MNLGLWHIGSLHMGKDKKAEQRRLAIIGARKQLAEGTWPKVMTVFEYLNPKAPRTPAEEFARLKSFYEHAALPNMTVFVDLLSFAEKEHNVTISYNLSMCWRHLPENAPPESITTEEAMAFLSCPDVLVGTRNGSEGAAVWLRHFSEAIPKIAPEPIQVWDKIFGEAVELLKKQPRKVSIEDIVNAVFLGEDEDLNFLKSSKPTIQ
ncbi:MAG: hypothetical protein JWO50_728 [Candidatus Kaiserbacteria bacterium]|nr:hypothetical protein [Candidatus Kaiserbacteria bacterium]